jgi:hypothetical protein
MLQLSEVGDALAGYVQARVEEHMVVVDLERAAMAAGTQCIDLLGIVEISRVEYNILSREMQIWKRAGDCQSLDNSVHCIPTCGIFCTWCELMIMVLKDREG